MKSIVLQMLMMGLWGSAATLLALVATALLRRLHAPSRWLCLLWGITMLRFVLPGGIPVSLGQPQAEQLARRLAAMQSNAPTVAATMAEAPVQAVAVGGAAPWYTAITLWNVLALVWLAGSAVLVLRGIIGYAKLHRQLALACKTMDGCYTCTAVDAPFTFGVVRPRIYMPQSLQGAVRHEVLLHERAHIAHGDTLTKPLAYLVACLHWWNPFAWLAFRQFERTMETACDEAAIRIADKEQRTRYCEGILQFARHDATPGRLAFGQGRVKDRIRSVLGFRRPATVILVLCAAIALVAGTACMAQPTMAVSGANTATGEAARPAATEPPATAAPQVGSATPQPTTTPQPEVIASQMYTAAKEPAQPTGGSVAFLCPVEYTRISRYMDSSHRGDDLVAPQGTPVYAAAAGVVTAAEWEGSLGNWVMIDHGTDQNGQQWETEYAHMDSLTVKVGQTVAQGEQIGTVGNTGNSTGAHLHLELHCNGELVAPSKTIGYGDNP